MVIAICIQCEGKYNHVALHLIVMFIGRLQSCRDDARDVIIGDASVCALSVNMLIGTIQLADCFFSDLYESETNTEVKDKGINAVRSSPTALFVKTIFESPLTDVKMINTK